MKCEYCRKKEAIGRFRAADCVLWLCEDCSVGHDKVSVRAILYRARYKLLVAALFLGAVVLWWVWGWWTTMHRLSEPIDLLVR